MKYLIAIAVLISATASGIAGEVSFQWDVGEADGYRIYYGHKSRKETDPLIIAKRYQHLVDSICNGQVTCAESFKTYCDEEGDPFCDVDYFKYQYEVDVGKVSRYTVEDLDPGNYFFTIAAYYNTGARTIFTTDPYRRESMFSPEIPYSVSPEKPVGTRMVSPLDGYEIKATSQAFCWESNDDTINRWAIWMGTGVEGKDRENIYRAGFAAETRCKTIEALPLSGKPIHLILWWRIGDKWTMGDRLKYGTADKTAPVAPVDLRIKGS